MAPDYTIYFGEKPFYITTHMNEKLYALTSWGGTIIINQPSDADIAQCIHDLDRTDAEAVIILTNRVPHYWNSFRERFTWIDAAGGLVINPANELLMIHRRGKWDLPKGKLDEGETLEACAIREVQEETGLQQVEATHALCTTYHTYHEKGKFILKASHWWVMRTTETRSLVPQLEEDILEAKWVTPSLLAPLLENTYPAIREVLRQAAPQLA